jgi:hypothetical protein
MKHPKLPGTLLLILLCASTAYSQSLPGGGAMPAVAAETKKNVFPQWTRDLRRAEIVAFGVFPFMMFFATFSVDTYRAANHDWDNRYLPWPAKGPGAIEMDTEEHKLTLKIAIAGSLVFALADHLILQHKRARAEKQRLNLPEGDLIILRKPWPPGGSASEEAPSEGEAAEDAAPGEAAQDRAAKNEADRAP